MVTSGVGDKVDSTCVGSTVEIGANASLPPHETRKIILKDRTIYFLITAILLQEVS